MAARPPRCSRSSACSRRRRRCSPKRARRSQPPSRRSRWPARRSAWTHSTYYRARWVRSSGGNISPSMSRWRPRSWPSLKRLTNALEDALARAARARRQPRSRLPRPGARRARVDQGRRASRRDRPRDCARRRRCTSSTGASQPWPYTYPDYAGADAIAFFTQRARTVPRRARVEGPHGWDGRRRWRRSARRRPSDGRVRASRSDAG